MPNIITSNHGSATHVEDILNYIYTGLRNVGANVIYSTDAYSQTGINIILENSLSDFYKKIAELKIKNKYSKLFVIVTERINNGIFNTAATNSSDATESNHYQNLKYWENRTFEFLKLLPHIDGFICLSEILVKEYAIFGKKIFFLGYAHPLKHNPINQLEPDQQDIDVLFAGSLTPYRKKIINELHEEGFKVQTLEMLPEYLRNHFQSRAKITAGLKLSQNTNTLSKSRAYYCLINKIPHLFENVDDNTDLNPYINFCEKNTSFTDSIIEYIRNNKKYPAHLFKKFENETRDKYSDIFSKLTNFLNKME